MITIKKIAAVAGIVALLAPSAAFAQADTEGYARDQNLVAGLEEQSGGPSGPSGQVQAQASQPTPSGGGEQLPFTGADLGVLAAAGGILAGLGFGLRRLTHRPTQA